MKAQRGDKETQILYLKVPNAKYFTYLWRWRTSEEQVVPLGGRRQVRLLKKDPHLSIFAIKTSPKYLHTLTSYSPKKKRKSRKEVAFSKFPSSSLSSVTGCSGGSCLYFMLTNLCIIQTSGLMLCQQQNDPTRVNLRHLSFPAWVFWWSGMHGEACM